jgi:hypothetical protein
MPRRQQKKNSRSRKSKSGNQNRPVLDVSGAMSRMGLPIPRLPFLIGSAQNLSADQSVYPKLVSLDFPIIPQFVTIATGACANSQAVDANALTELATDFYALFQEYCVVGVTIELRCNATATPQGLYLAYIDEKSSTAPLASEALSRPHVEGSVSNTESPSKHILSWKARDYLDLQWSSTASASGSPAIPCYFKIFASTSATGTSASTGAQIMVTGAISLCFRGYAQ